MSHETKCCKRCGEVMPVSMFYRNPSARDGLRTDCKTCHQLHHKPKITKGLSNPYTTHEIHFMELHYHRLGPSKVARRLGRSSDSVRSKWWAMKKANA